MTNQAAGGADAHMEIKIDESLHSRQLAVYGCEAMKRMATSSVLISGANGLGVEIAKNVILAGVRTVTIHDNAKVSLPDLSVQFYLTKENFGKNRAEACKDKLQELNTGVGVHALGGELTEEVIKRFHVVVCTTAGQAEARRINEICHAANISFIWAQTRGLFARVFTDFGPSFTVFDVNGEEPHQGIVASITGGGGAPTVVTCVEDERLEFQDGELVTFSEVVGMEQLNTCGPVKVKNCKPHSFELDLDTGSFSAYRSGGIVVQVKEHKQLAFKTLAQALAQPGEFLVTDFSKFERPALMHLAFQALDAFEVDAGRPARPANAEDASKLVALTRQLNEQQQQAEAKIDASAIDEDTIAKLAHCSGTELNPMAAMFGGVVGQEVVKAVSGKFHPIFQWLYFDSLESLPTPEGSEGGKGLLPAAEYEPVGSRYRYHGAPCARLVWLCLAIAVTLESCGRAGPSSAQCPVPAGYRYFVSQDALDTDLLCDARGTMTAPEIAKLCTRTYGCNAFGLHGAGAGQQQGSEDVGFCLKRATGPTTAPGKGDMLGPCEGLYVAISAIGKERPSSAQCPVPAGYRYFVSQDALGTDLLCAARRNMTTPDIAKLCAGMSGCNAFGMHNAGDEKQFCLKTAAGPTTAPGKGDMLGPCEGLYVAISAIDTERPSSAQCPVPAGYRYFATQDAQNMDLQCNWRGNMTAPEIAYLCSYGLDGCNAFGMHEKQYCLKTATGPTTAPGKGDMLGPCEGLYVATSAIGKERPSSAQCPVPAGYRYFATQDALYMDLMCAVRGNMTTPDIAKLCAGMFGCNAFGTYDSGHEKQYCLKYATGPNTVPDRWDMKGPCEGLYVAPWADGSSKLPSAPPPASSQGPPSQPTTLPAPPSTPSVPTWQQPPTSPEQRPAPPPAPSGPSQGGGSSAVGVIAGASAGGAVLLSALLAATLLLVARRRRAKQDTPHGTHVGDKSGDAAGVAPAVNGDVSGNPLCKDIAAPVIPGKGPAAVGVPRSDAQPTPSTTYTSHSSSARAPSTAVGVAVVAVGTDTGAGPHTAEAEGPPTPSVSAACGFLMASLCYRKAPSTRSNGYRAQHSPHQTGVPSGPAAPPAAGGAATLLQEQQQQQQGPHEAVPPVPSGPGRLSALTSPFEGAAAASGAATVNGTGSAAATSNVAPQGNRNADLVMPSGIQHWNFHIDPEELSLGQLLGRGGFGDVYRGMWRGTRVAAKVVSLEIMTNDEAAQCKEEIRLMFRLHHPNIIQLLGATIMPTGHLAIVMELAERGSLYTLLHRGTDKSAGEVLDMRRRIRMAVGTANGLQYLHGMQPPLVHRDIKSMNLLVTADWGIKVCDFGLSRPKNATTSLPHAPAGTPAWMAPEALLGHKCDEKSDVYSFGMVMYELFTGKLPWSGKENFFQMVHMIGNQARRPELPAEGLDPQLAALITACWAHEPQQRPTIGEALAVLLAVSRGLRVPKVVAAVLAEPVKP